MSLAAILVLAAGTFAFRVAGPLLAERTEPSPRVQRLLSDAAVLLLVALVATSALTQADGFAGWARPVGVAVGGVLALLRLPFVVVVVSAAATTAVLRAAGVA